MVDPTTITGIALRSALIVSDLRLLIHNYKQAESSINALIQECETLHFVWNRLCEWALDQLCNPCRDKILFERFLQALWTAEGLLDPLEQRIQKWISPSRRRNRFRPSWYIFNENILRAHETSLNQQNGLIMLLLDTIQLYECSYITKLAFTNGPTVTIDCL
jgi:hypothetical protein